MAKPAARILLLQGTLALLGTVIVARSGQVQLFEHAQWKARAEKRMVTRKIPARRGNIYDRNGVILATTEVQYRLSITLRELRDTVGLVKMLPGLLNISKAKVEETFARGEYPFFNGPFSAEQIAPIRRLKGIHLTPVYRRVYPQDSTALAIVGSLNEGGSAGIEGIEASYDSLLRGEAGEERAWRDASGQVLESPGAVVREPVAGASLYLTIDRDLQAIVESELLSAVAEYHAEGGDFVIYDLETGELLANASFARNRQNRIARSASAIVSQAEPGSTSKLFTAAAILASGSDTTPVSGEGGRWRQPITKNYFRTIEDVHHVSGLLGLGDAIKFSSNIAMSKFSLRLDPVVQYTTLRDFGFGTSANLNFQNEASGKLVIPGRGDDPIWTRPSQAMGYYFEASATQLAVAYGAIGNHGVLLAPTLVREVRSGNGTTLWRHRPHALRQVIPDSVAAHLVEYLGLVTDSGGTGALAQLDDQSVAGKTGTAVVNSRVKGTERKYRSSFAGLYPKDHPKIAFMSMIDKPSGGKYYGGAVVAPMIRDVLQNALAMMGSPIDRKAPAVVSEVRHPDVVGEIDAPARTVSFPLQAVRPVDTAAVAVPELAGQSIRAAALMLHQLGFEVKVIGRGRIRSTLPSSGDSLPRGSTVTLRADSLP